MRFNVVGEIRQVSKFFIILWNTNIFNDIIYVSILIYNLGRLALGDLVVDNTFFKFVLHWFHLGPATWMRPRKNWRTKLQWSIRIQDSIRMVFLVSAYFNFWILAKCKGFFHFSFFFFLFCFLFFFFSWNLFSRQRWIQWFWHT